MNAIVTTQSGTVYRFTGTDCERLGDKPCCYSEVRDVVAELGKPLLFCGVLKDAPRATIRVTRSTPVVKIEPLTSTS